MKLWAGDCEASERRRSKPAAAGTNNLYSSNRSEVRETQGDGMAKGNRESKKPKKEKVKTIAAAPSQKGATAGWQPTFGLGKKKQM